MLASTVEEIIMTMRHSISALPSMWHVECRQKSKLTARLSCHTGTPASEQNDETITEEIGIQRAAAGRLCFVKHMQTQPAEQLNRNTEMKICGDELATELRSKLEHAGLCHF